MRLYVAPRLQFGFANQQISQTSERSQTSTSTPVGTVIGFWLAIYGAFANWLSTLLAALWATGSRMMPMAGGGHSGTSAQELIIQGPLVSLSLAMIAVCVLVLFGLRATDNAQ